MTSATEIEALSPLAAAARLAGRPGRVLLHSGRDDDGCGRYSLVAADPALVLEAHGRCYVLRDGVGRTVEEGVGDPLAVLERLLTARGAGEPAVGPFPEPVAVGYLGYDLGRSIERLGPGPTVGADTPDLWMGFYDAVWCHDARTGCARIASRSPAASAALARALTAGSGPRAAPVLGPLVADDDADAYRARVERIGAYIAAGDVYQVNLARRLTAPLLRDGDALALYQALDAGAPAGFGALLEAGTARLLSASPERFLARVANSEVLETRPIKGTRRRPVEPARRAAVAAELRGDAKELAEHLMIVDLERNDLGRVAQLGTVRVEDFARVVELPTLLHLISTVRCRLRPDAGVADILRATFPGGSITGAPKIRAMEIIDELEPVRRGPYTGAIGYFGRGGAFDLSIAIRTVVLSAGEARLHVGGGIVADSTPARELEETEEKAAAWRATLSGFSRRAAHA